MDRHRGSKLLLLVQDMHSTTCDGYTLFIVIIIIVFVSVLSFIRLIDDDIKVKIHFAIYFLIFYLGDNTSKYIVSNNIKYY